MDINGESEITCLLDDKVESDNSTNKSSEGVNHAKKSVVNANEAFYIMVGFTLGAGILVMPFIVRELGIVVWTSCLIGALVIQCTCTYILNVSTQHLLEQNCEGKVIRDAYQAVAELSGGIMLRNASVLFMYISHMSICIALLLVSGTILADVVPIGPFSHANHVRIWTTIIIVVLTPIMYLGTYSELRVPAIIALVTSLTSATAIIVNSILAKCIDTIKSDVIAKDKDVHKSFLIHLGTIFFVSNGATLTIPNITVLSTEPKKLIKYIIACYVTLCLVFLLAGLVPYFVFGENLLPSITSTFDDVIKRTDSFIAFKIVTMVIQLLMLLHLIMASILAMNPCFLHQEEYLNIPHGRFCLLLL